MPHVASSFTFSNSLGGQLLAGTSLLALSIAGATPALAQPSSLATTAAAAQEQDQDQDQDIPPDTGTAETPEVVTAQGDVIIVTGIRQSLETARNTKKNSEQIVDSISAQDIGALPDRSVSEALQRIPGVTLQRTNAARDPARLSAEGGGVFIRGLSWVRSEINGRDTFSANNGRALSFEDIPADLLAGVDVYKNPSADMIEGGIGGLVNLRTRKPFDQSGQLIAFSADYNYADLREKGFWSANALYSNRWTLGGAGDFGILLSGSINNIGNRTDSVQTGDYTARGEVPGTGPFVPNTLGFRRIDWEQRRTAFAGSAQWSPAPNFQITLEGIYAKATPKDIEFNVGDYFSALPNEDASYVFDSEGILQSGTVGGRFLDLNTRYGETKNKTEDYSMNVRWEPIRNLTLTADIQRVVSSRELLSMTAFVEPQNPFTVDFDLSGDTPRLVYSAPGNPQLDQANYWWAAAMDHFEHNDADQWAYRADAEYEFDNNPFMKSFRFGARATDRNAISRSTGWNWGLLSRQHWGGGECGNDPDTGDPIPCPPVFLNEQGGIGFAPAGPNPGLPDQSFLLPFDNFFRGDVAQPGGFWFPTADLVSNGTANAFSYLQSTLTAGWGWVPIPEGGYSSINDQDEKTLAGYGLLRFGMDDSPLGRFDGNIGVRVVRTKNNAGDPSITVGATAIPPLELCEQTAADEGIPLTICNPLAQVHAAIADGGGITIDQVIPTDSEYTDVLPSLNLRFYLQDNMFLRFAAAKAMVRPSFAQLQPVFNLGFNFETATGFPSDCVITGSTFNCPNPFRGTGANPTLRPIKSDQFDVSWEYYFGSTGQLSAALFYKRVKDFIFADVTTVPITAGGQTFNFDLVTLQNGDKGTIKGFELAYQQFFDFLPRPLDGFGIGANLTHVDAKGGRNTTDAPGDPDQVGGSQDPDLPLEGMSKWAYNLTLMYSKYGVDARLAYNWRSKYLLTTSAANINRPVWSEDYGQLDGSIFYNVTRNIKLGVQATNILNSRTFLDVGGADRHPRYSWNITDRRFAFILRGQF